MLKEIESDFDKFCKDLSNDNRYKEEVCYLFGQALYNIKNNHLEIAMFILCVIIESISFKKNKEPYRTFDTWLSDATRLSEFTKQIKSSETPIEIIKQWHSKYRETYGPRKNFVKTIVETYKSMKKVPSFMQFKTEKSGGRRISKFIEEGYKNEEELYGEFEKVIKHIYDEYRSPFVHAGKFLGFDVKIHTNIGGISVRGAISLQDMASITLNVMKTNLR